MTAPAAHADDIDDQDRRQDDHVPDDAGEPREAEQQQLLKDDGTPFTRADLEALQLALSKARRDARRAGKLRPGDAAPDVDLAVAEATTAAESRWKPIVVRTAARTAFVEAGLTLPKDGADAAMARVIRLLDLDDLDVTDDGQVDGLREQVEAIRRDFPELFATARPRPPRVDAAERPGPKTQPKTSAELLAAALTGG